MPKENWIAFSKKIAKQQTKRGYLKFTNKL